MMPARYLFLVVLMGLAFAKPAYADGKTNALVTVQINQQQLQFEHLPRLVDVLQPVALQKDWYWPASALFRLDAEQPERLRQQLLQRLTQLTGKWQQHSAYVDTIAQLGFQLQQWQLAERVNIDIDYDLARLRPGKNPQFEPGYYQLTLSARPAFVSVIGVARSEPITHHGNTSVSLYAQHLRLLPGASKDWLYILQPDGVVLKAGVANWNAQHQEVMPGSQLFVPFDTSFFGKEFSDINQSIIQLARHRVFQ